MREWRVSFQIFRRSSVGNFGKSMNSFGDLEDELTTFVPLLSAEVLCSMVVGVLLGKESTLS